MLRLIEAFDPVAERALAKAPIRVDQQLHIMQEHFYLGSSCLAKPGEEAGVEVWTPSQHRKFSTWSRAFWTFPLIK